MTFWRPALAIAAAAQLAIGIAAPASVLAATPTPGSPTPPPAAPVAIIPALTATRTAAATPTGATVAAATETPTPTRAPDPAAATATARPTAAPTAPTASAPISTTATVAPGRTATTTATVAPGRTATTTATVAPGQNATTTATVAATPTVTPTATLAATRTVTPTATLAPRTATPTPAPPPPPAPARVASSPTATATLVLPANATPLPGVTAYPNASADVVATATVTAPAKLTATRTVTATATATPTQTPSPTESETAVPDAFGPESLGASVADDEIDGAAIAGGLVLAVPYRSQFDGTTYQNVNCGPTSLGMVLEAYGLAIETNLIRRVANTLQGTDETTIGIALDFLTQIASDAGLQPIGVYGRDGYHRWSLEQIRDQLRRGYPVIALTHLRSLPDHQGAGPTTNHYIVLVGYAGDEFIYNDAAFVAPAGYRRTISSAGLRAALELADHPFHAASFAPTGKPLSEARFAPALSPTASPTAAPAGGRPVPVPADTLISAPVAPTPLPTPTAPPTPTSPPTPSPRPTDTATATATASPAVATRAAPVALAPNPSVASVGRGARSVESAPQWGRTGAAPRDIASSSGAVLVLAEAAPESFELPWRLAIRLFVIVGGIGLLAINLRSFRRL